MAEADQPLAEEFRISNLVIVLEIIQERVSVITKYDRAAGTVMPVKVRWQTKDYLMQKLGYYHRVRQGRTVQHIFHVTDGALDFRLRLDSDTLHWTLEQVSDGNAT